MSFDLGVFYTKSVHSDKDAMARYIAYCEEEDISPFIEPSEKVSAFLEELTSQYPQIDDCAEESLDNCPWSIAFDVSEGHVLMPMVFSKVDQMYPIILSLAEKYGLVCVDPQSEKIISAPIGIYKETKKPWWKIW